MNTQQDRTDRFQRLMPKTTDLTLIILKGHLLIEEQFNDFLDRYPIYPRALDDARLTFAQKLRIVRAFCILPGDSVGWRLADELNKLRNKISHHVEVPDLCALVDAFITIPKLKGRPYLPNKPSRALLLKSAISYTGGWLGAATEAMVLIQKTLIEQATKQSPNHALQLTGAPVTPAASFPPPSPTTPRSGRARRAGR